MTRINDLHEKWIKESPDYRAEYEALEGEFSLLRARLAAGLTQEELAQRMGTKQGVIARLESGKVKPSTRTLERLAAATGTRLRIIFEPIRQAPGNPS